MMYIAKKHLPRRTFLRGMGVTLALPLLDSMVPAQTPLSKTAATPKSRFLGIYVPHGATMDKWTPAQEGTGFEFSESLKPLEKLRDRVNIISNLAHPLAGGIVDRARPAYRNTSFRGRPHTSAVFPSSWRRTHRDGRAELSANSPVH